MAENLTVHFTYLDAVVVAIITIFAFSNARKGFAAALLRFLPILFGVLLSWKMSGEVIKYVRGTFLFSFIMSKISAGLNIGNILPDAALGAQNNIISAMKIPQFIKSALVDNNNSVVYSLFNAETLKEYIAGFLTNMIISASVVILLYFVGLFVGRLVLKVFSLINDIPVLGFFSKVGGFIVGILKGVCIIWIACIVITFFCIKPFAQNFIVLLESSYIAGWLYKNNILLYVVLQIFA